MQITFNSKSFISFYSDLSFKKKDQYGTDVMPNETIYFFKEIIKASNDYLYLYCTDDYCAKISLKDIKDILIWWNRF